MGGKQKTSTHDVTIKVQLSPYLRSRPGTALEGSQMQNGPLTDGDNVIITLCSSTSRVRDTSHSVHFHGMR